MSLITAANIAAIVVAAIGSGVAFAYVLTDQRRAAKKPLYLWKGIVLLYFVVVYLVAECSPAVYYIRSGLATRMGVIILTSLIVASVIVDWRKR